MSISFGYTFEVPPRYWGFAAIIAALSLWPFALYYISGDVRFHFFNLECFGRAMLEGDIYPRWCSYANNGTGSAAMFFYFPFPYMVSLPFYPFLTTERLLILQLFIINFATLAGCMLWFKQHIKPIAALVLALLYLWFPYRNEVLFYRTAMGELWVLTLFPWLMWSIEKLQYNHKLWPLVALMFALCILSHVPSTLVMLLAIAVMFLGRVIPLKSFFSVCLAGFAALLLTAIYWLPAFIYHPYVMGNAEFNIMDIFPNRQVMWIDLGKPQRVRMLINSFIALILAVGLGVYLLSRTKLRDNFTSARHIYTAFALIVAAVFIFLPISAPLWQWLYGVSALMEIVMPWRFQSLLMIAVMLLGLVLAQAYMKGSLHRRTLRNDLIALFALLFFQSMSTYVSFLDRPPHENYEDFLKRAIVPLKEYRTIWQPRGFTYDELVEKLDTPMPFATIVHGKGHVRALLKHNKIMLEVEAKTPIVVMLNYIYFPTWRVEEPKEVTLAPEKEMGRMQLKIPKGMHHIILKQNAYLHAQYPLLRYLPLASALLWLGMITVTYRRMRPSLTAA